MFPEAALILALVSLVVPAFFILTWLISSYHRLRNLRKAYLQAYAQIDVQLRIRYDLILRAVEVAKGYIHQDPGAPDAVVAARNAASAANLRAAQEGGDMAALKELAGAETALSATLTRLFALVSAYPDLNLDKSMSALKAELAANENQVASARQAYNDAVMRYNAMRGIFPNNLIAAPLGFGPGEPFTT